MEIVCTAFAWLVCVWLIVCAGARLFLMLGEGRALDFMPFVSMALGGIGILLMLSLSDERKARR